MAVSQAYQTLWDTFVVPFQIGMADIVPALQQTAGPWFQACVGLYLIANLLIASWTPGEEAIMRAFRHIFAAALVYSFAFLAPSYNQYVVGMANATVNELSAAVAGRFPQGGAAALGAASFDVLSDRANWVSFLITQTLTWKDVALGVEVAIASTIEQVVIFLLFFPFALTSILFIFVLGIAPICVAFYLFPVTRRFFDAWLGTVVGIGLAKIFTVVIMTLQIGVLTRILTAAATQAQGGAVDAFGGALLALLQITGCSILFVFVTGSVIWLGFQIGGAAGAAIVPRIPSVARGAQAVVGAASGGGYAGTTGTAGAGSSGFGGGGGGGAGGGLPQRSYAFNRTVGSAP